jgi:hypothetical protein
MELESEHRPSKDAALSQELPPGWTALEPEEMPRETYWPAALALGITFLFAGAVTSYIVAIIGFLLFVIALIGWIGEVRHAS